MIEHSLATLFYATERVNFASKRSPVFFTVDPDRDSLQGKGGVNSAGDRFFVLIIVTFVYRLENIEIFSSCSPVLGSASAMRVATARIWLAQRRSLRQASCRMASSAQRQQDLERHFQLAPGIFTLSSFIT